MGVLRIQAGIPGRKEQHPRSVLSDEYLPVERGKQELPESCPGYCGEKVFLYPKHLKMVGRYNSLFALDESSVSGMADTEGWKEKRIDRIVVNLL